MRQLKFRAYDNINKEWLLGYKECGGFSMIGELMLMGEWQAILSKMLKGEFGENGKELFVQQYTGLTDKNGVEIAEGDILKYGITYNESFGGQVGCNGVSIVSFEDGSFMIDEDFLDKDWAVEHEVIGNIFENNELLKV